MKELTDEEAEKRINKIQSDAATILEDLSKTHKMDRELAILLLTAAAILTVESSRGIRVSDKEEIRDTGIACEWAGNAAITMSEEVRRFVVNRTQGN